MNKLWLTDVRESDTLIHEKEKNWSDRSMDLPVAFQEKMKKLLADEYEAFVQSYENERVQGLRFNTLKADLDVAYGQCVEMFELKKIPWVREGYYYGAASRPGKHPYHEAGVYYIQEPSAMAVVELLDPQPGDLVLDLCAAPGGKTTHIAERLNGEGFLLSNEILPARARILSQNVERMGIGNAVVSNEESGRLAACFPGFFDKIVVDAPCSGEGMFRKDEEARSQWSPDHVVMCAKRQNEILCNAAEMLKPGGRLVYSTCTFSPEENEGTIGQFLGSHPEFTVEPVNAYAGFSQGRPEWTDGGRKELASTFRIWPHKLEGEGHYLAVLKKSQDALPNCRKVTNPAYVNDKNVLKEYQTFCRETLSDLDLEKRRELVLFGDQLYLIPPQMPDFKGLKVVRPGLHLGTLKKNRFEPSHALALFLNRNQVKQWYCMAADSDRTSRYLRGEALTADGDDVSSLDPKGKGWVLMEVDGYSAGWAKLVGTTLKNHYPKGLRRP